MPTWRCRGKPDLAEIEAEGDAGLSEALGVAGVATRVLPQVGQTSRIFGMWSIVVNKTCDILSLIYWLKWQTNKPFRLACSAELLFI